MLHNVCRRNLTTHNLKRFLIATLTTSAAMTSNQTTRTPAQVVYARETPEGVGATVRRSIGTSSLRNLTPFLMLDHAAIQEGSGFPTTPTAARAPGMMQHEDFTGSAGKLLPGDVQWMTAGRGIVHSEMPLFDEDPSKRVPAEALQLWIDLPADKKMIEPSYQEKKAADIDSVQPSDGVDITVISGESHGVTGFVRPVGGCWFMDVKLTKPGASVFQALPEGWTGFAYIITGSLQVGEEATPVDKYNTVVLSAESGQNGVLLTRPEGTTEETRLVLIAGEPLLDNTTVQHGPFVCNSRQGVIEAITDYQMGRNGFERAPNWKSKIGSAMRH